MKNKVSPLAPKKIKSMRSIPGINIYTYSANLYKNSRLDVLFFYLMTNLILQKFLHNQKQDLSPWIGMKKI